MAIFSMKTQSISRSKGNNAVAASAQRRSTKLKDSASGLSHDFLKYKNNSIRMHSEISVSSEAPAWVRAFSELHTFDPNAATEKLWNLVESTEKRKDSQLAREVIISLPRELNDEAKIMLVREYVSSQFTVLGMVADWSIRFKNINPQVMIMLTYREVLPEGFGQKVRAWNDNALHKVWREQWADHANRHLLKNGVKSRIYHRSNRKRCIDLIPTKHLGKAVMEMEQRWIEADRMREHQEIQKENLRRI